MHVVKSLIVAVSALSGATWADLPCQPPSEPNVRLNVETATPQDFKSMYLAVKAYQRDAATYRECLDVNVPAKQTRNRLFNESVDAEQALAEAFNASFVAFKQKMQERSR